MREICFSFLLRGWTHRICSFELKRFVFSVFLPETFFYNNYWIIIWRLYCVWIFSSNGVYLLRGLFIKRKKMWFFFFFWDPKIFLFFLGGWNSLSNMGFFCQNLIWGCRYFLLFISSLYLDNRNCRFICCYPNSSSPSKYRCIIWWWYVCCFSWKLIKTVLIILFFFQFYFYFFVSNIYCKVYCTFLSWAVLSIIFVGPS